MGVSLPGITIEQRNKFEQYLSLLLKWNKTYNLTAICNANDVVNRHFLESIAIIPHLGTPHTLLDLGTGAGFPGLPIAIMRPDWNVRLLDATQKKITFCQEIIRCCKLKNADTICARAENLQTQSNIGKFDLVISRATWTLSEFLPIALPYTQNRGGTIVAIKGSRYTEELSHIAPLPNHIHGPKIDPVPLPSPHNRSIVLITYMIE